MKLEVFFHTEECVSGQFLQRVFLEALEELKQHQSFSLWIDASFFSVNLLIIEDEEMQDLNKQWRGKDKTTDVLSFPYFDVSPHPNPLPKGEGNKTDPPLPLGEGLGVRETFGEIFLSLPQCTKQAEFLGHSLEKEMSVLLVHSILHLFSFDHIEEKDFLDMNSLEKTIEKRLKKQEIV